MSSRRLAATAAGPWTAAALLLAGLGMATVALTALRQPMAGGDYLAVWGLKARALHRAGTLDALFRVDPSGSFSHPEYPPLWPLVLSGVSRLAGRYDELLLGTLWPLLCAAAAAAVALRTRAPAPLRLCAAAAVTLLPYYRTPVYVGYAEALLLALVLGALAALEHQRPYLGAALFTLAAWTKLEGVLAGLVAAAVLLAARRFRPAAVTAAGVLLGAVLPWRLLMQGRIPQRDFSLAAFDPGKLLVAGKALLLEAVVPQLAWLLGAALLLALAPRVRAARRGVLAGTALYGAALSGAFAFSALDPAWHVRWTWDRLALLPAAALVPVLVEAAWEAMRGQTAGDARAAEERLPI